MKRHLERARPAILLAALCGTLLLSGCKSPEEKAEGYYQSGLALLAEGDEERALIELLNVFDQVEFHKEALQTYADIMMKRGRESEARSYYQRLVERHPDMIDARFALAQIAIRSGNWQEAERQRDALAALQPGNPKIRAIGLVLEYRDATLDGEDAARQRIAAEAAADLAALRVADETDDFGLNRIVIDHLATGDDPLSALPEIDAALERDPGGLELNMLKARILATAGEREATGVQLRRMIELFPENRAIQQALISWFLAQEDVAGAEAFLRGRAGADTADTGGHVDVVQLLLATRGREAAREELARLVAANTDTENGRFYRAMLASMDFEEGQVEAGIAGMRAALDGAAPGARTYGNQVILARMLVRGGDDAGARALVTQVLEADPGYLPALKLRAEWLIEADKPGEAIIVLRTALNQAPRDAETLTLLALAHQRNGDTELVADRLRLAVEASNGAPAESLRYARHLIETGRARLAVPVLQDVRLRAPQDLETLLLLANIHLGTQSWIEAQDIVEAMRGIDTDIAREAALTLQAAILQGQNRTEDSLALLQGEVGAAVSASDLQATRSVMLIVQTHIRNGDAEAARAYLDGILETSPDNPNLQLLDANLHALMGRRDLAEAGYRALIDRLPQDELPVRLLMGILSATGRQDEASVVLSDAIDRMPNSVTLLGIKANHLERDRNYAEAITIYETLYDRDNSNIIVVNNLASLLSVHGGTPESLDRAYNLAKRLRDTAVPAFQDTYGWIEYLRGNYETALEYLGPAAAELDTDPFVQYHLGMVYAKLGRGSDAKEALSRALELAGESLSAELAEAQNTLATLSD
ncbi:tetratricopeptide repeat protein [Thetidibacter halocola]|uniref:Tetratricopeptide repeat protein n=1 Tax=Thetidibacter halocola TaxID=2827239 RepID=A0A8J7WCY3_9RHOB|nr:tetratricopeptide repeat protein [Thetidibacter halocola]MBS0124169.1 tetratricopeptide repeat protein [Thetidibacter halocola]